MNKVTTLTAIWIFIGVTAALFLAGWLAVNVLHAQANGPAEILFVDAEFLHEIDLAPVNIPAAMSDGPAEILFVDAEFLQEVDLAPVNIPAAMSDGPAEILFVDAEFLQEFTLSPPSSMQEVTPVPPPGSPTPGSPTAIPVVVIGSDATPTPNTHSHANTDADADTHANHNSNPDHHADTNVHADADTHSHANTDADADTHANHNSNPDHHADTNTHSYANTDADDHPHTNNHADADHNPNANGHSHANGYTDPDPHADGDADTDHNPNANGHPHGNTYTDPDAHADDDPYTNDHSNARGFRLPPWEAVRGPSRRQDRRAKRRTGHPEPLCRQRHYQGRSDRSANNQDAVRLDVDRRDSAGLHRPVQRQLRNPHRPSSQPEAHDNPQPGRGVLCSGYAEVVLPKRGAGAEGPLDTRHGLRSVPPSDGYGGDCQYCDLRTDTDPHAGCSERRRM